MVYFIYILECHNSAYYTGYTTDIKRRYQEHVNRQASKYTRSFPPRRLAVCWQIDGALSSALKIEKIIKCLPRADKETLVTNPAYLILLLQQKGFNKALIASIREIKVEQVN